MTTMRDRIVGTASRRTIAIVALGGVALRLAFAFGYWTGKPLTLDEQEYLRLGLNLAAGRGYVYELAGSPEPPDQEHFGRAPFYPLFLAALFTVSGRAGSDRLPDGVPGEVKLAQAIGGGVGILLVSAIARRVAGARGATIAAILAAVYPPLVWIGAYALSESLYLPLVLAAVRVLARAIEAPRDRRGTDARSEAEARRGIGRDRRSAFAGGALTGLACLTRPATIFFLPLAAWLAWRRRDMLTAVLLVAGAGLTIAPWTLRNVAAHGRPILVASSGGVNFWMGNHPRAIGEGDMSTNAELKYANRELRAKHPGLTPEALEPIYYREAWRAIAAQPLRWLGLLARKLFYTFVPIGPSYTLRSPRYYWTSVIPYALVLPAAALGLWQLRRSPARPDVLLALAASAVIASVVFFPQERFRIPVIDPTLLVLAAAFGSGRAGEAQAA